MPKELPPNSKTAKNGDVPHTHSLLPTLQFYSNSLTRKSRPRLTISSNLDDPRLSCTAPEPISAVNTAPTTHTDRHTEHDLAIDPTNSYMYCQIASRSTIEPADIPHPTHV